MTKSLHISHDLRLPLDWMTLASVIYGARGSGKTTLGAVMAEEVHKAGQRFCAIDLKGDWWGLKSSADGRSAAIPAIIFGGDHADVPLEDGAGVFVAETVAGLQQSCILDFENLSKGKQTKFLATFFETLYHRNREPLLLFLDEAQRYAPQKTFNPESAQCLGAVEDLVKLGRKHGIGVVVITQRGAGLNKEISELCDLLIACRTPGPLDQDRVRSWLEANVTEDQRDATMSTIASLKTGSAIFASGHPDLKLFGAYDIRRRETFDSSATPKVGQRRVEPKLLAKPDLDVLREKMAAAIERVKANDPRVLQARIAELEKALRDKPVIEPIHIEVPAISDEVRGELRGLVQRWEAAMQEAPSLTAKLLAALGPAGRTIDEIPRIERDHRGPGGGGRSTPFGPPARASQPETRTTRVVHEGIDAYQQSILDALAKFDALGATQVGRRHVGAIAGKSPRSSMFDASLAKMRAAGLVDYGPGGTVSLTAHGKKHAARSPAPATPAELIAGYKTSVLDAYEGKLLDALVEEGGAVMSRAALAEATGLSMRSSMFDASLASMRKLGIVEYRDGGVCAADSLLRAGR